MNSVEGVGPQKAPRLVIAQMVLLELMCVTDDEPFALRVEERVRLINVWGAFSAGTKCSRSDRAVLSAGFCVLKGGRCACSPS